MVKKKITSRIVSEVLEGDAEETLKRLESFQKNVTHLRYEGKASFGKNLKRVCEMLEFFNDELIQHLKHEEEIIFPFLETHVPKLEPIIHLLQAEHEDFRRSLGSFEDCFEELLNQKNGAHRGKVTERLQELGTYLIYLLRNHIQAEEESVHRVIDRELSAREKKELENKIRSFHARGFAKRNGGN